MAREPALRLFALALVGLAWTGCGDSGSPSVELEAVPRTTATDEETTSTTTDGGGSAASDLRALQACLDAAGLDLAAAGDQDLPITASEGTGPPIVNGVPGTGVRASGSAAVFFVYDSAVEAVESASLLGATADGTVVVVADDDFPLAARDAIVDCAGSDSGSPAEPVGDEAADVESCVAAGGVEIAEPGATDLVISGRSGAGLPVIDGVQGIGVRSAGRTAVIFVYESPEVASGADEAFLDSPEVEQNAPRVTVVVFDNVLFAMDADFPQDAQIVILDCAEAG